MSPWIDWLGGREFFLCVGCGIACTFLVHQEKISDMVFATIIIATIGAFITGRTTQKVKGVADEKGPE